MTPAVLLREPGAMGLSYTRIDDGRDGESRFIDVGVALHEIVVVEDEYSMYASIPVAVRSVMFVELPGWKGISELHNASARQLLVVLSGVVDAETSDGGSRRLGPGDVLLLDDVIGPGHRDLIVEAPVRMLVVQLGDDDPR